MSSATTEHFSASKAEEVVADGSRVHSSMRLLRAKYNDYFRVSEQTGFASSAQRGQLRDWLDRLEREGDPTKIREALENFERFSKKEMEEELELYHQEFINHLKDALQDKVISRRSYEEWVSWVKDSGRDDDTVKYSLRSVLPQYLAERRALAKERADLRNDKRLSGVKNAELRSKIEFLRNDDKWFGDMEFTQRKNLIDHIRAGLAAAEGGYEYEQLKKDAEKKLMDATKTPQPALHRDKVGTWLARIFEEGPKKGAAFKDMEEFVKGSGSGSLAELIKTWRAVAIKFWTMRKDPAFAGVKTEFTDTKGFLWMHYDERVSYVSHMKNQRDRAAQLRSRAWSLLKGASPALDSGGTKRWLTEYVFNGNHTLPQLESIVNGNMAVRLEAKVQIYRRYERAKDVARKHQGIRGMKVPEKSGFLSLHYDAQLAEVSEMEHRIMELEKNRPDFLLIRHEMDRKAWDAAMELIEEGKKKAVAESDLKQLHSMEEYVKHHHMARGEVLEKAEKGGNEVKEIDELITSLPSDLQSFVLQLAAHGGNCVGMISWALYNREWCNKRRYLTPERELEAVHMGKAQALQKVRKQQRGVVDETIQGETADEEYIELSHTSPTNICLDIADGSAASALVNTANRRQDDHRAWYWTNVILHRGGTLMSLDQQVTENKKIYRISKLLKEIEKRGEHYTFRESKIMRASQIRAINEGKEGTGDQAL